MASPQGIATAMLNIERIGTGYSQPRRWSFVKDRNARPLTLIAGKAADCSSSAGASVAIAGYPVDLSGTFYTGNQRERLTAAGAQDLPFSKAACQVGDILWRDGHTEIVTSPGYQTGARIDENGQSSGGVDGDQTGQEFATSLLSSNWTRILRFKNTDTTTPEKSTVALAAEEEEEAMKGLTYTKDSGKTRVYMLFNDVSGFYSEFGAGTGNGPMPGTYVNPLAQNWKTGSWPTVTESHANALKHDLDKIRKGA